MANVTQTWGAWTTLTNSGFLLNNSATAGFLTKLVDNTSTAALDYEIWISLAAINTAPANDKAIYVYALPWTLSGSTWQGVDWATTTVPTTGQGNAVMASPNNMKMLGVLNYTTQNQPVKGYFQLSNAFGSSIPDGWSLFLVNYGGPSYNGANYVSYRSIAQAIA